MKLVTFLCINFIVSFFSDIVLNDLSTSVFLSLKPYFHNQSIIVSAIYAGITVEIALLITIGCFYLLFHSFVPNTLKMLFVFCVIAFIIGFIADIFIDKMHIFGNRLDAYYKKVGAGFWGAAAFLFSILISYFIQKEILPIL
uniref:Uncharacterized protein n=1 Tax=viral metagenome TaxID=1070528 RepID=A0A6C0BA83_9ZZZZ